MASFSSELQRLMAQFGGYAQGIPNLEAQKMGLREDASRSGYVAGQADLYGLQRAGMGRSVASGFAQGGRQAQSSRDAAKQILDLITRHGELKGQQQMQLLGTLAPIAYEESQKPSALAKLAGGALGLGGKFLFPNLGGVGGLEQVLGQLFGGGNQGQGMATPSNFNFGFNPYSR